MVLKQSSTIHALCILVALVAPSLVLSQDCDCGDGNCDLTPPCIGCICDGPGDPGCACIANCLDPTCDIGICQTLTCTQDGCGAGIQGPPDCLCDAYCSLGVPECGGESYPCDESCTEFGGIHCDCESTCGGGPLCTGSDYCSCWWFNVGCPLDGDCGLWCSNAQGPACEWVLRTCECGGADCDDYEGSCDPAYCSKAQGIPPQQGFKPCGGELTCKDDGCGGVTCPDGELIGGQILCPKQCAEGQEYNQPCTRSQEPCQCDPDHGGPGTNNCPRQNDCAGPRCDARPTLCLQWTCNGHAPHCMGSAGCECDQQCSSSITHWDCGVDGGASFPCGCRGVTTSCTECTAALIWSRLCGNANGCPRQTCAD